jgi:arylformamidase
MRKSRLFDLTLPLDESTPPFPGDPPFRREFIFDFFCGNGLRLSAIALSAHLGTHIDAPAHLFEDGNSVDEINLATLCGPAVVIEILTDSGISAATLFEKIPRHCNRILIKTRRSEKLYPRPTAWIEPSAATLLVERKIRLVGIDSSSVDNPEDKQLESHRLLLQNELVIVENLVLQEVAPGPAELFCLPLKIVGGDGAPARVVLRRVEEDEP